MQVKHGLDVWAEPVEGAPGVTVRWLWSESDGAPSFALRLFEVDPGASTPYHTHAHEHEVYILSGQALLRGNSQARTLVPGDTVLVLPYDEHQFQNTGSELLRFLCSIPSLGKELELTVQVSLYPLREMDLAPTIGKALEIFQQQGLEVAPGTMSSLISGDMRSIFRALQRAFEIATDKGDAVMVATFSNACPIANEASTKHPSFQAIGQVKNEFSEPTSPEVLRASDSKIIIQKDYSDGLMGLKAGDMVLVVFHFHRSEGYNLRQHPRGDRSRPRRGVFSLRSPKRPNPIGITEVQILEIKDNILTVRGLDALDGTPVLDLKPA